MEAFLANLKLIQDYHASLTPEEREHLPLLDLDVEKEKEAYAYGIGSYFVNPQDWYLPRLERLRKEFHEQHNVPGGVKRPREDSETDLFEYVQDISDLSGPRIAFVFAYITEEVNMHLTNEQMKTVLLQRLGIASANDDKDVLDKFAKAFKK